ncbi:MAG TPA: DUF1232 domain-containing protein [Proteobacteria bacterium]|nr:DUF1232 domain-containing protein [Pseudomonadota bacterium]
MSRSRNSQFFSDPTWWRRFLSTARLCWRLLGDRRVPFYYKLIPSGALLYFLSPYDLLPDLVIPGLGQLDDLLILALAARIFLALVPAEIVKERQERIFTA